MIVLISWRWLHPIPISHCLFQMMEFDITWLLMVFFLIFHATSQKVMIFLIPRLFSIWHHKLTIGTLMMMSIRSWRSRCLNLGEKSTMWHQENLLFQVLYLVLSIHSFTFAYYSESKVGSSPISHFHVKSVKVLIVKILSWTLWCWQTTI